jgi:hypothetical protein
MIGVFDDNEDLSEHSFTGRQFSEMPEAQQEALLRKKSNLVFSRAEPKHKQVRLLCFCSSLFGCGGALVVKGQQGNCARRAVLCSAGRSPRWGFSVCCEAVSWFAGSRGGKLAEC